MEIRIKEIINERFRDKYRVCKNIAKCEFFYPSSVLRTCLLPSITQKSVASLLCTGLLLEQCNVNITFGLFKLLYELDARLLSMISICDMFRPKTVNKAQFSITLK